MAGNIKKNINIIIIILEVPVYLQGAAEVPNAQI